MVFELPIKVRTTFELLFAELCTWREVKKSYHQRKNNIVCDLLLCKCVAIRTRITTTYHFS